MFISYGPNQPKTKPFKIQILKLSVLRINLLFNWKFEFRSFWLFLFSKGRQGSSGMFILSRNPISRSRSWPFRAMMSMTWSFGSSGRPLVIPRPRTFVPKIWCFISRSGILVSRSRSSGQSLLIPTFRSWWSSGFFDSSPGRLSSRTPGSRWPKIKKIVGIC